MTTTMVPVVGHSKRTGKHAAPLPVQAATELDLAKDDISEGEDQREVKKLKTANKPKEKPGPPLRRTGNCRFHSFSNTRN